MKLKRIFTLLLALVLSVSLAACGSNGEDSVEIVNVSYDPTRELYAA